MTAAMGGCGVCRGTVLVPGPVSSPGVMVKALELRDRVHVVENIMVNMMEMVLGPIAAPMERSPAVSGPAASGLGGLRAALDETAEAVSRIEDFIGNCTDSLIAEYGAPAEQGPEERHIR